MKSSRWNGKKRNMAKDGISRISCYSAVDAESSSFIIDSSFHGDGIWIPVFTG
jgi:hypothetical protein